MTGRARRETWLAFTWHSAEFAIVIALFLNSPRSFWLGALLGVASIGWAWSCGHLPGRVR